MAGLLRESGVPNDRILLEETGYDTLSSARAVHKLLLANQASRSVRVATSAYHLPRCLILLCIFGISARPCPLPSVPAASRIPKRWYWRLREIPAVPYDAALAIYLRLTGRI